MTSVKPRLLAPRPLDKPVTHISVSKEWVLPPRPKPGRKPIQEDPPTKRKAQNRAAQRAFRERRANRVAELEDHIMKMQRETSIQEGILRNEINTLQNENGELKKKLLDLEAQLQSNRRYSSSESLESLLNMEPQAAVPLKKLSTVSISSSSSSSSSASPSNRTFSSPSILNKKRQSSQEIDFTDFFNTKRVKKMPVLNDFMGISSTDNIQSSLNSTSTTSLPSLVSSTGFGSGSSSNTGMSIEDAPFESCGFCSDDTPCVCRDAAKEQKKSMQNEIERKERELINEIVRDVRSDVQQMAQCSGDPGSCAKCQVDPQMTKFCKTVATNHRDLPSLTSLGLDKHYIPCSDAFRMLSQRAPLTDFSKVAASLNRSGMMVEVESVVSCIRDLDRGFSK